MVARNWRGTIAALSVLVAVVLLELINIRSCSCPCGEVQQQQQRTDVEQRESSLRHESSLTEKSTTKQLKSMGLEQLYDPKFDTSDPWKAELYQRLDRIRVACGALCQINSVEALKDYSVPDESQPFPMVVVPNVDCPALLGLADIDASDTTAPPIPPELHDYFTMGGAYKVTDDKLLKNIYLGGDARTNVWKEADIDNLVVEVGNGTAGGTYRVEGTNYVRNTMKQIDMSGKSVLVIGSERPWVEAICLHLGAAKVTTLEYGKIVSEHPKVFTLTPDEFRSKYLAGELEEFDGMVSHSSLEHSGLGRYGDALNPWGDILAVARAWCVVKPGGFMYLGVPTGRDHIRSNFHRCYGKIRWPLVAANWRRVDHTDGSELERVGGVTGQHGGIGYVFEKVVPSTT